MSVPNLMELADALHRAWGPDTGSWGKDWPVDNPARGQCTTSSLIVQDYFGGDIVRYRSVGEGIKENHYFNVLADGTIVDTTGQQYKVPVTMTPNPVNLRGYSSVRDKLLSDSDTKKWYEVLAQRVRSNLGTLE